MLGGLNKQIESLREAAELPLTNPGAKFGIDPQGAYCSRGHLETARYVAKALANSTDATFLGIVGSELAQKYIGEVAGLSGSSLIWHGREPFDHFHRRDRRDREQRLDSTTSGDREVHRTLMQLLSEMMIHAHEGISVIAATNGMELLIRHCSGLGGLTES